ncbi:50S ribosomal protein L24 [Moorella sulfitireducens (nom. illeg.)]|uniref:50S ribosomal protein L24 n=1 Tax=Neomoorella sulfitireducens TaxID=2972948 RepID=UPI0021ABF36D|nr:50S ribosomal protein L24 [Moorella sulfitireducens]
MTPVKVHVKKGDLVMVIAGKDAGKKGKVLSVDREKGRVIVEGVNIVKRHTRPTPKMTQGGIIEKEAPVASSNVMLFCNKCNQPTRIGKQFLADGTKTRVCKKCGEVID